MEGPVSSMQELMYKDFMPIGNPRPVECDQILEKLYYYTLPEVLDLLDKWCLKVPDFDGKPAFILTLRGQVIMLKRELRKPKKKTKKMLENEGKVTNKSYGKTLKHTNKMKCSICEKTYYAMYATRSKYCCKECGKEGVRRRVEKCREKKEIENDNKTSRPSRPKKENKGTRHIVRGR